jgi:hypothetical protein
VTDPKGKKPDSDQPHEDEFPLELHDEQEGLPGENLLPEAMAMNASTEEFHFSGPAEELDFTEPADFAFAAEQPAEGFAEPSSEFAAAEPVEAEGLFGAEEAAAEPVQAEEAAVEPELAGEGIADLDMAEGLAEGEEPKPRFALPPWVRTAEWVAVGVLAAGALLAVVISVIWVENPARVTLILNIGCPLMLALIPYALWRSMDRWVTPAISAIYTVMLALSTAVLVAGTWFVGLELARYDWQYSRTRVAAGKPPHVNIEPRAPVEIKLDPVPDAAKPPAEPAAGKNQEPAAGKNAEPAAGKTPAEPAAGKAPAEPAAGKNAEPAAGKAPAEAAAGKNPGPAAGKAPAEPKAK